MKYSDSHLKEKTQELYLASAGFVVRLVFSPTEQVFYKRKLVETVREIWGKEGFLRRKGRIPDFTVEFRPEGGRSEVLVREVEQKFFFLIVKKDFQKKKFSLYYSVSPRLLDVLLREIFVFLLQKEGFLLHCSSLLDKNGILSAFMAHSGGGKTTTANLLSKSRVVFSDDVVIVRKNKKGWLFSSPPFVEKEKLPLNLKAQKAKLYFVEKGNVASKNKITDKSKILPRFLEQIWQERKGESSFNLGIILKFVRDNEFYNLITTLDKNAMGRVFDET
ncbi:MAG: hypothetical protein ACOYT7_00295 [Patescibacteria group bacterium]